VQIDSYQTTTGPYQYYDAVEKSLRSGVATLNQDPAQVFPENALKVFCTQTADLELALSLSEQRDCSTFN
jgi:hypothetical protein